jgi:hypothetical protein
MSSNQIFLCFILNILHSYKCQLIAYNSCKQLLPHVSHDPLFYSHTVPMVDAVAGVQYDECHTNMQSILEHYSTS